MKHLFKLATFAIIAFAVGNANAAEEAKKEAHPYKEITVEELAKMQTEQKDLVIIDSRSGDWFDGTLIKGAKQLGVEDTTAEKLGAIAPNKATAIVFYCTDENCPSSAKAAHKAAELGYTNLYKLPAGIKGWQKANLPTEKVSK